MATVKPSELLNGIQGNIVALDVDLQAGDYKKGSLLGKKTDGTYALLGTTDCGPEKVDCVLSEDIILESAGQAVAYFSGVFNINAVVIDDSIVIADVVDHARKLQIFIK